MNRARVALWTTLVLLLGGTFAGCGDPYGMSLLAGTEPPTIRVRLGKVRGRAKLAVGRQSWRATSIGGRHWSATGYRAFETSLEATSAGIRFQGRQTGSDLIVFVPADTYTLDDVEYEGVLRIHRQGNDLVLVGELDLETYVAGVIGNEVGPDAEDATYRAQAVTARTYAYRRLLGPDARTRMFHLYDSAASQVYRGRSPGYGVSYERMRRATRDTRGVILMWRARPLTAYYASTCGGHTTDCETSALDPGGAEEVLRGVPCRWCKTSKYYAWPNATVTEGELVAGLKRIRRPVVAPIHAVEVTARGRGGWARTVRVVYGPDRKTRDVPGPEFRSAARLRSHNIESVTRIPGGFRFSGRGWGHGVGMCQWGAIEMGRAGANEAEILRYYYPGVTLEKVY